MPGRRLQRVAGRLAVVLGVVVSWTWSAEIAIAEEPVATAAAGAATFGLLAAGLAILGRRSPHQGRRARTARAIGLGACAIGAIGAVAVPTAVSATTTGTVTTTITTTTARTDHRLAGTVDLTSDDHHLTVMTATVHLHDRRTPLLEAAVTFADGSAPMTCTATRTTWARRRATVTLLCDDFAPLSSLRSIAAVTIDDPRPQPRGSTDARG